MSAPALTRGLKPNTMMVDYVPQLSNPRPQRAYSPMTTFFSSHLKPARTLTALALLLFGLNPSLTAQDPPAKPIIEFDEDTDTMAFAMNESNGMQLPEFIKWAQLVTNKRFTFNPQELTSGSSAASTVSFLGTFRIKKERFQEDFY